ncbi:glycoside hydrolase family 16 protein [Amanita thiersii Skay4041]|uniref:Glycoside hydrolase family 16 protein n=1 Tax=Amanita thiersii Skay4041 TaxID=703135 RepID=A0A2A9NRN3_9AGAR|nr:glycoside hydrolase family 16 protein [Amanita thiersii Skay4041]
MSPQGRKHKLAPPRPRYGGGSDASTSGVSDGEQDSHTSASHSRTTSNAVSYPESPPVTPRSVGFSTPTNPFSPPASVTSFNSVDPTPGSTPSGSHHPQSSTHSAYPFDATSRSHVASVSTSAADLTRLPSSYFGSRPATGDYVTATSTRPSSARLREAFTSPPMRPLTIYSSAARLTNRVQKERPKSTMLLEQTQLEKPWTKQRDPYSRIAYYLTYAMILLGIAAGAVRCFFGWHDVRLLENNLCMVLDEEFDSPDSVFGEHGTFFREVEMGGFGNGEFEMTTESQNNSFVLNGHLYIAPTLTAESIGFDAIEDGHVYNITGCTYNITKGLVTTGGSPNNANQSSFGMDHTFDINGYTRACSGISNRTLGSIINPVQSARLTTRRSASIKYGRVEVRAKIPTGDWLWPAIWMLPVDNKYGPWPMSGEIDIMEARGNGPAYPKQGSNYVRGSLNWGPTSWINAVSKTFSWWTLRRGTYADGFHTYALEWDESFMRIYVDTRLHHLLDLRFNVPFWERGDFPPVVQNGSEAVILTNPWVNGTTAAPFDQPFYLILSLAVGGTNGWFPDGKEKPWLDGSTTAMADFWRSRNKWLPTWPLTADDRSFVMYVPHYSLLRRFSCIFTSDSQ